MPGARRRVSRRERVPFLNGFVHVGFFVDRLVGSCPEVAARRRIGFRVHPGEWAPEDFFNNKALARLHNRRSRSARKDGYDVEHGRSKQRRDMHLETVRRLRAVVAGPPLPITSRRRGKLRVESIRADTGGVRPLIRV